MKSRMKTLTLMAAALVAGCAVLRAGSSGNPDIIRTSVYGTDDRQDYFEVDKVMKQYADSTVALFANSAIPKDEATGRFMLKGLLLKGKYNLQDGERFASQPVGAFCSGVLVGDDLVLTAGHCFQPDERGGPCARVKLVFGYAVTAAGQMPSSFPAENVYSCRQVIAQKVQDEGHNLSCDNGACTNSAPMGLGADYALVRLDRKVSGRYPLAISRAKTAGTAKLAVIGYPSGLPVKVASNGSVRSISQNGYFVADLDTFGGNSGSPVFNTQTMKIEGVLVRGGTDYVYGPGDTVEDPRNPYLQTPGKTKVYGQNEGRGEDVTLISEIQALIPQTAMEKSIDGMLGRQRKGAARVVPAVYLPGQDDGPQLQPAVYTVPEPSAPVPVSI